jgi:hypothetical protein
MESSIFFRLLIGVCCVFTHFAHSLSIQNKNYLSRSVNSQETTTSLSRRDVFSQAAIFAGTLTFMPSDVLAVNVAAVDNTEQPAKKQLNLSNEDLAQAIASDISNNQFMVSGAVTRSLYLESATFQDEIDTYQMDAWIKGTQKLFVGEKSHVDLVDGSLQVSPTAVNFRFKEYLQFRIPFRPTVYLTGQVVLKRDLATGLISSYQEIWDQDITTVLTNAKFNQ